MDDLIVLRNRPTVIRALLGGPILDRHLDQGYRYLFGQPVVGVVQFGQRPFRVVGGCVKQVKVEFDMMMGGFGQYFEIIQVNFTLFDHVLQDIASDTAGIGPAVTNRINNLILSAGKSEGAEISAGLDSIFP